MYFKSLPCIRLNDTLSFLKLTSTWSINCGSNTTILTFSSILVVVLRLRTLSFHKVNERPSFSKGCIKLSVKSTSLDTSQTPRYENRCKGNVYVNFRQGVS